MGLPAFVVLDRLSAADGGSLIADGVGLLVQDEAVVDEATLDHKSVIVQAFYPVLLTVTSEFGIHLHPALAGSAPMLYGVACALVHALTSVLSLRHSRN